MREKITAALHRLRHFHLGTKASMAHHKAEWSLHASYLGFTFWEGHGMHAIMAGGLLAVILVGLLIAEH